MITYDDFAKIEIKVGTITKCEPVAGSAKLLRLEVDFGPLGTRQVLTGIAAFYTPEELTGMQTLFIYNMEPRKMIGLESQGMILGVGLDHTKKPILVKLSEPAENGDGAN